VGGGIGDFTYQIILQSIFVTKKNELKNISTFALHIKVLGRILLQSIFVTKKYELKNISTFAINIYISWAKCHFNF
jgi:hypothetical protein